MTLMPRAWHAATISFTAAKWPARMQTAPVSDRHRQPVGAEADGGVGASGAMQQHEVPRINPHWHLHIGRRSIEDGGNAIRRATAVEHDSLDKAATELQVAHRGLEPPEAQCQAGLSAGALNPVIQTICLTSEEEVGGEAKGVEDFGVAGIAIGEGDQFDMAKVMYARQCGVPPQECSFSLLPGPEQHPVTDFLGPERGPEPAVRPVNDRHVRAARNPLRALLAACSLHGWALERTRHVSIRWWT